MIDDDCTATVTSNPMTMPTAPPPRPMMWFIARSTEPRTSWRMLRVISQSARKMSTRPNTRKISAPGRPGRPRPATRSRRRDTGAFTALRRRLGPGTSATSLPRRRRVSTSATRVSSPVISSSGSRTATASRLKKSCIVAAVNARWNSSRRRMDPSDASVFVTVVPMFAPHDHGDREADVQRSSTDETDDRRGRDGRRLHEHRQEDAGEQARISGWRSRGRVRPGSLRRAPRCPSRAGIRRRGTSRASRRRVQRAAEVGARGARGRSRARTRRS